MPTYSYRCPEDGTFEKVQRIIDHARAECPTCGEVVRQILTSAPGLDIEAMAKVGMPGAWEKVGDRITKRHIDAGQ